MNLLTEAEVAERFQVSEADVREWRRRYDWPHVKLGRRVRFTEEQVERVVAFHSVNPGVPMRYPRALPGQTWLSAARSR